MNVITSDSSESFVEKHKSEQVGNRIDLVTLSRHCYATQEELSGRDDGY